MNEWMNSRSVENINCAKNKKNTRWNTYSEEEENTQVCVQSFSLSSNEQVMSAEL